jgi:hypothetical protein
MRKIVFGIGLGPGVNVTILKIFSPKNWGKLAIFTRQFRQKKIEQMPNFNKRPSVPYPL